jgi:integrase
MIFRRPGRPSWYVRLRAGGRDRWISLRTTSRREAEARAARIKYADLPEVIRAVSPPPSMPLAELWRQYADSSQLKPSTLESYEAIFRSFARFAGRGSATADRITPAMADHYLRTIPAARTANLARGVLSVVWRSAGLTDPWAGIKPRRGQNTPFRPFSDAEILRLLELASPEWRALIQVAVYTGLRFTDAVHLHRDQIAPDLSHLELRPAKTQRTGRAVWVPIHPALRPILATLPAPRLFPALADTYDRSRTSLPRTFAALLAKAKIAADPGTRVGFHSLRVSFATRTRLAGVPVADLQGMLGHSTSAMSRHYVVSPEALTLDAVPALDGSQTVAKSRRRPSGKPRKSLR